MMLPDQITLESILAMRDTVQKPLSVRIQEAAWLSDDDWQRLRGETYRQRYEARTD